jgi:two-component system, sensor histidine kinase PdtaS
MYVGDEPMSRRTFALVAFGSAVLVVFALVGLGLIGFLPPGQAASARALWTDLGSIVFGLAAAMALLFAASRYHSGNPLRWIWFLIGAAIAAYTVGDIIWTILEIRSQFGAVPYPSVADVAFVAFYPLMAVGLIRAARAFGRSAAVERALKIDIVAMFLFSAVVYAFVAAPIIVDAAASMPEKILGVAYPVGDIVALLGPALFIAVVASSIGRSKRVRHWWILSAGLGIMALSDIAFTKLDWAGLYVSGDLVDYAWMLSLLVIAIAGSMAADVAVGTAQGREIIAQGPRLRVPVEEVAPIPDTGLVFTSMGE